MSPGDKSVILMMFMQDQWPATKLSLHSVVSEVGNTVPIVALLNGSESSEIVDQVGKDFPYVKLHTSPTNLGVAGGRNYLMCTREARAAQYIFHLDNDIILCHRYFEDMIAFMKQHPEAGIAGPLVFRADPLAVLIFDHICASRPGACSNRDSCRFLMDGVKIKKMWVETGYPRLWHLGTNVNWLRSYCSTITDLMTQLRFLGFVRLRNKMWVLPDNKQNPEVIEKLKRGDDCIEVSNLAGCATVYRRTLIEEIGGYDEGFNPYLFEDSEFSIRAIKAGYVNYVNTNAVVFHGTDLRNSSRSSYMSRRRQIAKARVLIRRRAFDSFWQRNWSILSYLGFCLFRDSIQSIRRRNITLVTETLIGARDGLRCPDRNDHARFSTHQRQTPAKLNEDQE